MKFFLYVVLSKFHEIDVTKFQFFFVISPYFLHFKNIFLSKFQQPSNKASKALVVSGVNSALSSHHGTLKEESSDDSTIISSQASTLTRAPNEVMTFEVEDLDPEVVIPSEPLMHLMSIGIKIFKNYSRIFHRKFANLFYIFYR